MAKKKGSKDMNPDESSAKMDVLKELKSMLSADDGEELKGLKKVTIAAPDKEGLAKGLQKAEEMVGTPAEESAEPSHEEAQEHQGDEHTVESIEAKIKELMDKKEELLKKQ